MKERFSKMKSVIKARKFLSLTPLFILIVASLMVPELVQGQEDQIGALSTVGAFASNTIGGIVALILSLVAYIFNAVVGLFITLMIQILINVAEFSNIIDVPTVQKGWLVVRDLCNMVFILIFLFIAFATILRIESFSVKKALPKLLIVAVLINFSRTIFGVIIDFSQIIMLSFVHTFNDGQGWFIDTFNTQHLLGIKSGDGEKPFTQWETVLAIIAGMFGAIITLIVVVVLVAVLIMRLVLLWVYTILSPLAFLGFAFDPLKKYVGFIWSDFIKQAIVGPMLAFFIWLALTTVEESAGMMGSAGISVADNAFFGDEEFQKFLITIALLIGGLMVTQKIGGVAGSAASKGIEAAKGKYGPTPIRWGRERWDAFRQRQEGERKQKAQKTGERMYGVYRGVTQGPKAWGKGTQKRTGVYPVQSLKRAGAGLSEQADRIPGVKKAKQWRQNKQEHQEEIFETFNKGEGWTSENGKYRYEMTDDGQKVTAYSTETNEPVTSMNKGEADYRKGYREGFSPAKQIKDEITKKRIDSKQKELNELSEPEIREKIEDKNASFEGRTAASLQAMEEKYFKKGGGEKEKDLFNKAKENVKDSLAAKNSFDEIADKYYAAWNNPEKEDFMKKFDRGDVNLQTQDLSQFEDKPEWFIEAAGDNADDLLKKIADRSAEADKTVKDTLSKNLSQYESVDLSDPMQKQIRKIYADLTGNIEKAFKDNQGRRDINAQKNYVKGAKANKLDEILKYRNKAQGEEQGAIDNVLRDTVTQAQIDNYSQKDVSGNRIDLLKKLYEEGKQQGKNEQSESHGKGEAPSPGTGQMDRNTEE